MVIEISLVRPRVIRSFQLKTVHINNVDKIFNRNNCCRVILKYTNKPTTGARLWERTYTLYVKSDIFIDSRDIYIYIYLNRSTNEPMVQTIIADQRFRFFILLNRQKHDSDVNAARKTSRLANHRYLQ